MADLVSKLTIDTAQFDRNITTTAQRVQKFEKGFKDNATNIAAAAGGIGVAFLGIQSAGEVFNKVINSIQTTGDAYQLKIDQMKSATDLFFSSVAQGNLSLFLDGLKDIVEEAGKLSSMLDNLGTAKLFGGVENARIDMEIERNRRIAKDKTLAQEERTAAVNEINRLVGEKQALTKRINDQALEAAKQSFNVGMRETGFNFEIGEKAVATLMRNVGSGEAANIGARAAELDKLAKSREVTHVSGGQFGGGMVSFQTEASKAAAAELESMKQTARGRWELANYYASIMRDDPESKAAAAVNLLIEAYQTSAAQLKQETKLLTLSDFVSRETGGATSKDEKVTYSTDTVARLEASGMDTKKFKEFQKQMANIKPRVMDALDAMEQYRNITTDVASSTDDITAASARLSDTLDELTSTAAEAFSGIEAIFGTNFISQGMQFLSTIDALRETFKLLDKAKEQSALVTESTTETTVAANEREAQSAMVAFSAQLLKFFSWAGFAAPFLAMATTMAATGVMGAAISAIPRFETGGIVGGNSFAGDNMLIRANSGEMILNRAQQSNLFNMINQTGLNQAAAMTFSKVEFEIKGRNLVGTLNAETNKNRFR